MKCPYDIGRVVDLSSLKCLSIVSFCFIRLKTCYWRDAECRDNLTQQINESTSVNNILTKLTISFIQLIWNIYIHTCTHARARTHTHTHTHIFIHIDQSSYASSLIKCINDNDSNIMYPFAFLATTSRTSDEWLRTCKRVRIYLCIW